MQKGFMIDTKKDAWPGCPAMMHCMLPYTVYCIIPGQYPMAGAYMGHIAAAAPRNPQAQDTTGADVEKEDNGWNYEEESEQYRAAPWLLPLLFLPLLFPPPPPTYYYNYYDYFYVR